MTENEALAWIEAHPIAGQYLPELRAYVTLLTEEASRQNLIAPNTVAGVWARHIVDSAQLWDLANFGAETSVDIGSGGGLPGMVLAIMGAKITLSEPRRLRADFLMRCVATLGLEKVTVLQKRGDGLGETHGIVTARAVSNAVDLIGAAGMKAVYVLPRGRNSDTDMRELSNAYEGVFHVKQSVTSPDSSIIIASRLKRRAP